MSPRAEERNIPKNQPRGEAQAQQEFEQEAAGLGDFQEIPTAAVEPLVEPELEEDDEQDLPNMLGIDDQNEVDLNEVLFRASERPDEDVRFGIPGVQAGRQQRIADVLRGVIDRGFATPDLEALLQISENLGL